MNRVLYARLSTDKLEQTEASIPAQLAPIRDLARTKGWRVVGVDSFIVTRGKQNSIFSALPPWFLSKKRPSTHANAMLNIMGYRVIGTSVTDDQINRRPGEVTATATHTFTTQSDVIGQVSFVGTSPASASARAVPGASEPLAVLVVR